MFKVIEYGVFVDFEFLCFCLEELFVKFFVGVDFVWYFFWECIYVVDGFVVEVVVFNVFGNMDELVINKIWF